MCLSFVLCGKFSSKLIKNKFSITLDGPVKAEKYDGARLRQRRSRTLWGLCFIFELCEDSNCAEFTVVRYDRMTV